MERVPKVRYTVVMPYSQNLSKSGEQHLSFFSAFIVNVAAELYNNRYTKKLILCGERPFGKERKSVGDLMEEALLRLGVPQEDIINLPGSQDNTVYQVQEPARYQRDKGLENEKFQVLLWAFHEERVRNHMRGIGLYGETVIAEDIHRYFNPRFDDEKLQSLPFMDGMRERENPLRVLSRYDRAGLIPRIVTHFRGGTVVDIAKNRDENGELSVKFMNVRGNKRLKEFMKEARSI